MAIAFVGAADLANNGGSGTSLTAPLYLISGSTTAIRSRAGVLGRAACSQRKRVGLHAPSG